MMKLFIIFLLFLNTSLLYAQNNIKEISHNRIKISKFIFGKVLDNNTFNSSIATRDIYDSSLLKIYSIQTYSPHAILNICIIYKKKLKIFQVKNSGDIDEIRLFLDNKNTKINVSDAIESKIIAMLDS